MTCMSRDIVFRYCTTVRTRILVTDYHRLCRCVALRTAAHLFDLVYVYISYRTARQWNSLQRISDTRGAKQQTPVQQINRGRGRERKRHIVNYLTIYTVNGYCGIEKL